MPVTFDDLIRNPAAKKVFFLEATYYDLTTRTTGTLYAGTEQHITGLTESPASTCYREGLDISSWVERSLVGSGGRLGGVAEIGAGETSLHNLDGRYDDLWRYAFDGRPFTIYIAGEDSPGRLWERSRWVPVLVGQHASHVVGMERVTLQSRDPRVALDVPLSTDFYKGFGTCLLYDGVNDKAVSASTFSPQASPTVEFRLRVLNGNAAGTAQVVLYHASAWTAAGRDWYFEISTAGVLSCVIERRSGGAPLTLTYSGVDVRDGTWRHAALVIDSVSGIGTLYIDGVSVASGAAPNLSSAACEIGIGTNFGATGNWANVEVDEVRYWSAVRAFSDLVDNRNKTVDPSSPTLLHYWRMDEATGATAFDQVTSGAINLTITGATWVSTYEGREDLVGKIKPRTIGAAGTNGNNVEGVLVDPQLGIWQFHNGRVRKFRTVYWKGDAKTEGVGNDYTTDLARGCITALVAVDGVVTADIDGEADGGYLDNPVDILRRLFTGWRPLTGDCLSFDGDDAVTATVSCPAGSMTIEAMAFATAMAAAERLVCEFRNGASAGRRGLGLDTDNQFHFYVRNDAGTLYTAATSTLPAPLRWCRLTGVLDTSAAKIRLYVDGELAQETSVAGTFTTITSNFAIGRIGDSAGGFWVGRIDDVRLWSTARVVGDVKDYAWQELVGDEAGLVQYWKLNDRSGSSAANAVSGGVAGTVSGATWLSSEDGSVTIAAAPFDWTTARALNTSAVTHHWSDGTTKLEAISEVANGPGLFASYESTGALRIGRVDLPLASRLGASAVYLDGAWSGAVYTSLKADTAALDDTDCTLTFEAWVYPYETDGTRTVAAKDVLLDLSGGIVGFLEGWRLYLDEGFPTLQAVNSGGGAVAQAATAIPVRAWTHLAACAQPGAAGKLRLLVNGVEADSDTLPAGTFSTNGPLWVGALEGIAHPFVGVIDEARLWDNPRTAANLARDLLQEIASVTYQELGDNGAVATLQGYWPMNDASGTAASDSVGTADLAFQGSPRWCRAVAATIQRTDVLGVPEAMSPDLPHALVRVGWGPCFRLLSDAEMTQSVSATRRAFVKERLRWATYEAAATRIAHPLTQDLDAVQAHFSTEAAGKAEAVRLSVLYSRERRPFRVRAARQFGRLEPGDLVRLVYDRQGMTNGSDFLALGVRELPSTSEVLSSAVTLWG